MANQYYWDLGFNFQSSPDPSNPEDQRLISYGFVMVQSGGNVDASPIGLSVGDTIGFNVFNTTPGVTFPDPDYSITAGAITFTDFVTGLPASPFTGPNPLPVTPMSPSGYGWSTYLSGVKPSQVATQSTTAPKYPIYNCIAPQTVANPGDYRVTFSLTVQGPPNGSPPVPFYADPEMSVGVGGTQ